AAAHRADLRVPELPEGARPERAAGAARAVEDDLAVLVRDLLLHPELEVAAGDEDGARHVALRPLVGLADVHEHRSRRLELPRLPDRDLADLGLDLAEQLLERAQDPSSGSRGGAPGRGRDSSARSRAAGRNQDSTERRATIRAPSPWRRSSRAASSASRCP